VVVSRKDNEPHPIDVYVGGRMRLRRIQLGLSQGALASKIGIRDPHLQADILRLISKLGNRSTEPAQ